MFDKGDRVVYPNHGAGTIVDVEIKEILGEEKKYYIMELPIGEMRVMIPVHKVEEIGIRDVIDKEEAENVFHLLKGEKSKMSQNWNRRYRANMEKLKTGDIYEVVEVVRNLTIRDMEKGLSTGEKKMLSNARKILEKIKNGEEYHFIEFMACPGGCIGGGGQPLAATEDVIEKRMQAIYEIDKNKTLRKSHENPYIKKIYEEFLEEPGSHKAHELLHTKYRVRGI